VAIDAGGDPALDVDPGVGVLAAVAILDGRGRRRRPAAAAGLLRRARPVPDGPGGRRRAAARQGTRRGRFRLRPRSPGEELRPQPGLDPLSLPSHCLAPWSHWLVGGCSEDMTPWGFIVGARVRVRRRDLLAQV
jgi:hypothetical protein